MIHKAFHPRVGKDRLYVPRKEEWRGLASIKDSVATSIRRLDYSIIEINQNTESSAWDFRRLAANQIPVKDPQLTLRWKISKK